MATPAEGEAKHLPGSPQAVHHSFFSGCDPRLLGKALAEETCSVASGWTSAYYHWWLDQSASQSSLLSVQLIGDANAPHLFTPMTQGDLAFSTKWLHSIIQDHAYQESIPVILPVLTKPSVVRQAVTGLMSGQIKLSSANVEAILVLANAIGVECLEVTCATFLCTRAHKMTPKSLLGLFKFGKHLSLQILVQSAATELVKLPWEQNMQALGHIARSLHHTDKDKLNQLVHHPERGAYSELQVLQLLEGIALAEKDVAAYVDIDNMQTAELDIFLGILVNEQHVGHNVMLRKVVQRQLLAKANQQASQLKENKRFEDKFYMTDAPAEVRTPFPDTQFDLLVKPNEATGKMSMFLSPCGFQTLSKILSDFTLFALHTEVPYIREVFKSRQAHVEKLGPGAGHGGMGLLSSIAKHYPGDYRGPFCIGVKWTSAKLQPSLT